MRVFLWRLWWHTRMGLVLLCRPAIGRNVRIAIVRLAFEAALRGEYSLFKRASDTLPDWMEWDARTVAAAALFYYDAGDPLESGLLVRTALQKAPNDVYVISSYGRYLAREGRLHEALEYLTQGLRMEQDNPAILNWLGNVYLELDELTKARACYEKVLRLEPDGGHTYTGLAHVAIREKNWDEAARCWREAIARLPHDGGLWRGLGDALYHLGAYEGAVEAYKRSISIGGFCEIRDAYCWLAVCYRELGDDRRARKYCEEALRRAPQFEAALELKEELDAAQVARGKNGEGP